MNTGDILKNHVYVDIRKKQATIVFQNSYGMFYDTIAMPFVKERSVSFQDPQILDQMMQVLKTEIAAKTGFHDFNLVLTIPDSFGINEKRSVYQMAEKYGISVFRFYSDLDIMAFALADSKIKSGRFMVLNIDDSYAELAEYEYENSVVEKLCTYVATEKNAIREIHQKEMLIETDTFILVYADEQNGYESFVQKIKELCNGKDLIFDRIVMPVSQDIFQKGLEKFCLKLSMRQTELLLLETAGPFAYEIQAGEDHQEIFPADTTIPVRSKEFSAKYIGDTGISISLYEITETGKNAVASWMFRQSQLTGRQLETRFVIEADPGGIFYLVTGDQRINLFDLSPVKKEEKSKPKENNGTVEDIIKDLISIVNNMEYGMQFVKNKGELQGMKMVYDDTLDKLKKYGVTCIKETNVPFDVRVHNAVDVTDDIRMPADYVSRIVRSGYIYKDKVLQYADVVVTGRKVN